MQLKGFVFLLVSQKTMSQSESVGSDVLDKFNLRQCVYSKLKVVKILAVNHKNKTLYWYKVVMDWAMDELTADRTFPFFTDQEKTHPGNY